MTNMLRTVVVNLGFSQFPIMGELIKVCLSKGGVELRMSDY
jgi:hypothetical protein